MDGYRGYKVIKRLGGGTFGEVFLVEDKQGRRSAAKIMKLPRDQSAQVQAQALIQKSLHNQNLVRAYAAFPIKQKNLYVILLEHCEDGLDKKIGKLKGKGKAKYTQQLMLDIAHGVMCLHQDYGLIHRDLKPENILIKNGHAKITDYGLSKFLEGSTATNCGTPFYMAPEIMKSASYGFGVDVWALGIIFLEMVFDKRIMQLLPDARLPALRDDFPFQHLLDRLPTNICRELIVGMLQKDPNKRMDIIKVVKIIEKNTLFWEKREDPNVTAQMLAPSPLSPPKVNNPKHQGMQ